MLAAIDIGGSKIRFVTANSPQTFIAESTLATPKDRPTATVAILGELAQLVGKDAPAAIGVSAPGPLNRKSGMWGDEQIIRELSEKFKCPAILEHDATAGGIAEARLGSAVGYRTVLYVTLSTGIGTGIILDSKPLPTTYNSEGGYQIIQHTPFPGKSFQHAVSGQAILRRFGKKAADISNPEDWNIIAQDLSVGIYNLITIIQPDIVVFAGGVSVHYDKFIDPLSHYLANLKPLYPLPKLTQAKFVETAPAVGALLLAQDQQ